MYELMSRSIEVAQLCILFGCASLVLSFVGRPDIRFDVDNNLIYSIVMSLLLLLFLLLLAVSTGLETTHILYPGVFG